MRHLLLCLLMVSLGFQHSTAQQQIDSLKTVIATSSNDIETVKTYRKLALVYEAVNFDSALYYYNVAMQIAQQKNWVVEQAKTQANIGFAYLYSKGSEVSIDYLLKGLELYQQIDDKEGILDSYYNLGFFSGAFEKHDQAISYYKQAIPIGTALNNQQRLGMIHNNLGLLFEYIGRYQEAIEHQLKALRIKEDIGDKTINCSYANVGLNYNSLGNSKMAIKYFSQSLEEMSINDNHQKAVCYNGLGDAYLQKGDQKGALDYYSKAFLLHTELNNIAGKSRFHLKTGIVYVKQNALDKAHNAFLQALEVCPTNSNNQLLASIYGELANLELQLATQNKKQAKYFQQAKSYATKVYALAKSTNDLNKINESAQILYITNKTLGNTKEALLYVDIYMSTKDSLLNKQKIKAINEVQTKYETEKKELEINLLNKENDLKTLKISEGEALQSRQQSYIILLVTGVAVAILFLVLIYLFYLQKNKSNKELVAKNTIISKQNEEKEVLLKEIHHRVKNNLQIISSLLDLQNKGIEDLKASAAIEDGQSRIKSMALIHHKLYQNENIVSINFREYTQQLLTQILGMATNISPIQIINIPENIEFDIDTAIPLGLILNELLTNACKYAFTGKDTDKIEISLSKISMDNYQLKVQDNGAGLPEDFNFKKSRSLGLRLVRRLSKQLFGSASHQNNNGAQFIITFKDTLSRKKIA
ncbi:MAG: tetratricopeptide repeat protein [Aureispira sp.]|nr:tetratricopeptide repeat protein [Aureispira sp.]